MLTLPTRIHRQLFDYLIIFLITVIGTIRSEERPPVPLSSGIDMAFAQRLLSSLPNIPNVIAGQMDGNPEELTKMVSSVLGEGLLTDMIRQPMQMAMSANMSKFTGGDNGLALWSRPTLPAPPAPPPPPPRAKADEQWFIDGVPVQNVSRFKQQVLGVKPEVALEDVADASVRNTRGTTAGPLGPTGIPPNMLTESLMDVFRKFASVPASSASQLTSSAVPNPQTAGLTQSPDQIDLSLIDPRRRQEIEYLLRRSPQKFPIAPVTEPTNAQSIDSAPSLIQANDIEQAEEPSDIRLEAPLKPNPADTVLSLIKQKPLNAMKVDEVKRLQQYLQGYEQTLQTRELLRQRQKLQQLQDLLHQQRLRIEEQRIKEEQLKIQEKQLEEQQQALEKQLNQQLNHWHDAFNSPGAGGGQPALGVPQAPTEEIKVSPPSPPPAAMVTTRKSPFHWNVNVDRRIPVTTFGTTAMPMPNYYPSMVDETLTIETTTPPRSRQRNFAHKTLSTLLRYEPMPAIDPSLAAIAGNLPDEFVNAEFAYEIPQSPGNLNNLNAMVDEEAEKETETACECIHFDAAKMKGVWHQALASKVVLQQLYSSVGKLFSISSPKQSVSSQEANIVWTFKTIDSRQQYRVTGGANSTDHKTFRIQMQNFNGGKFGFPLCLLKAGIDDRTDQYDYMVIVNSNGPCRSSTLLVRDPVTFFDRENSELIFFLKHKIQNDEMDKMEMAPHSMQCSA